MSAETPPHDSPEGGNSEHAGEKEASPEQLQDIEHKLTVQAEQFQAAKVAAEAVDAEKLAEVRKKLNLETDTQPVATEEQIEAEYEPIPFNKSVVKYDPPVTRLEYEVIDTKAQPSTGEESIAKEEIPIPTSKIRESQVSPVSQKRDNVPSVVSPSIPEENVEWEEVREPIDWGEAHTVRKSTPEFKSLLRNEARIMRKAEKGFKIPKEEYVQKSGNEGMEDHMEALSKKNAAQAKEYKEIKEKEAKKKEVREKLVSAAKNGAIAVGLSAAAAGAVTWAALGASAYLYTASPVFGAAAGLSGAGFLGAGVLGVAAVWFGAIALQEFSKAGGFRALISSLGEGMAKAFGGKGGGGGGGGAKKPAAKPAGGGGAHH